MDKIKLILISFAISAIPVSSLRAQTFESKYTKSFSTVMNGLEKRFNVKFRYSVDTVGLKLTYADFRVRAYSLDESLRNILSLFDFNYWKQTDKLYKIKPYEYPRRHVEEGEKMLAYLNTLYSNKDQWEMRRDSLRKSVRNLLGIDQLMDSLVHKKPVLSKIRKYDGYTVQNICIETLPGLHLFGSIYSPSTKGKHALIICPDGHFNGGRYREDEQLRLATLARMGAVCADFDLYGWGESEKEVGLEAHQTSRAHVVQAMDGLVILDYLLHNRKDIDRNRIGVNGGSGGGTHTILLTVLDNRFTASAPTVNLASHFDGGCPCESGKPVQLACGGTCNPELAVMFAPRPMLIVSDGGDWTSSVPTVEFPYLERIYGFYNAKDKVRNVHLPSEHHDFGPNKRNAVYDFFIDVFKLDRKKLDESKVTVVSPEILKSNCLK